MDTDILDQAADRDPVSEAKVRSILQRLLRLLAGEVARRLPAPSSPERSRSEREDESARTGRPDERVRGRTADQEVAP